MKKFLTLLMAVVAFSGIAMAQLESPVKWSYTSKKIGNKEYELRMVATIDNNWHVYAQDAGEGPEPTSFTFSNNPLVKLEGKVQETGKLEKSYDPNFKSTLKYYSNKVEFVQKVKLKAAANTVVKGTVTYMVCNDRKCLPPKEIPFSIKIDAK